MGGGHIVKDEKEKAHRTEEKDGKEVKEEKVKSDEPAKKKAAPLESHPQPSPVKSDEPSKETILDDSYPVALVQLAASMDRANEWVGKLRKLKMQYRLTWNCAACTFGNSITHVKCDMCEGTRAINGPSTKSLRDGIKEKFAHLHEALQRNCLTSLPPPVSNAVRILCAVVLILALIMMASLMSALIALPSSFNAWLLTLHCIQGLCYGALIWLVTSGDRHTQVTDSVKRRFERIGTCTSANVKNE